MITKEQQAKVKDFWKRVRLTPEDIVPYLKNKYPHMYKGNDEWWCRMREDALLSLLNSYDTELLLDAQLNKVLKDPDLALMLNPQYIDWKKQPELVKQSTLALVIPLTEALKEVEG